MSIKTTTPAVAAVLALVLVMSWLNERSFQGGDEAADETAAAAAEPQAGPATAPAPAASGPVVITANEQVWLQVKDGATTLKEGLLEAGQSFEVPATAQAPVLKQPCSKYPPVGASQSSISPATKVPGRRRSIRYSSTSAKGTPPAVLMASSRGRRAVMGMGRAWSSAAETRIGRHIGRITCQNACVVVQPSSLAASSTSDGMSIM